MRLGRILEHFKLGCRSHVTLYVYILKIIVCHWQQQILNCTLNITLQGTFNRLALHKFRHHLAFCVTDTPTLLLRCLHSDSRNCNKAHVPDPRTRVWAITIATIFDRRTAARRDDASSLVPRLISSFRAREEPGYEATMPLDKAVA